MRKRSEIGKPKTETPAAEAPKKEEPKPSHVGKVMCDKCGLEQPGGTSDCLSCGATLPEFKLVTGDAPKVVEQPMENISKLAYDLKSKDLDVTLAQLAATPPDDRRALQEWVNAKSADVPPRVRMILERLNPNPPPLAGPDAKKPSDEIFKNYQPTPEEARGKESKSAFRSTEDKKPSLQEQADRDQARDHQRIFGSASDEVTYTSGKEMYRVTEFCTFDVGPISMTTKIQPGEIAADALERARADVEAMMATERVRKRDSYIATWKGIKPAFAKAVKEQAAED